MNRKVTMTVGGIVLSLGFACQAAPPVSAHQRRAEQRAHIDEDLAKLRALDIVETAQMLKELPQEAWACYGEPCTEKGAKLLDTALATETARLDKILAGAEAAKKKAR